MEHKVSTIQGWKVVAAGFGINLAFGVLYAWSVVSKNLVLAVEQGGWGWSSSQASLPYALAIAMYALSMAVAGAAQDKYGPRLIASIGGVLCGSGLILASFGSPDNAWPVILGFGLMTGLGVGVGYSCATPAALKWFSLEHAGLITGIVVGGFGLASAYIAPLTEYLLSHASLNTAFLILGISFLLATLLLAQFIKNPPADYALAEESDEEHPYLDYAPARATKERDFYVLLFSYAFAAFAGHMIIGHLAKIASLQVPSFNSAFMLVTVLALGNAAGRVAGGAALDALGRNLTLRIVFVSQALMMLFLSFADVTVLIMLASFGVGFFYGANLAIYPTITANRFGKKYLGANYGLLFLGWGVGGVFGAMSAGLILDKFGSYFYAYLIAAGLCLAATLLSFFFSSGYNRH